MVAVFLILTQSLKVKNQYFYSTNVKYPQMPYGHGIHTYMPLINTDKNSTDNNKQTVFHQIYCTYIPYISLMLNCQQQQYDNKKSKETPIQLFKSIIDTIVFTQQLPKYNIYIMSAFCIRSLVTYGIIQMNGFVKLGSCNNILQSMYNPTEKTNYCIQMYHYFYVLQQIIQIMPIDQFLLQFFEAYGFADPQTGEFADRFKKTDPEQSDKMQKLMQVMIVHLMSLVMNNLSFCDP